MICRCLMILLCFTSVGSAQEAEDYTYLTIGSFAKDTDMDTAVYALGCDGDEPSDDYGCNWVSVYCSKGTYWELTVPLVEDMTDFPNSYAALVELMRSGTEEYFPAKLVFDPSGFEFNLYITEGGLYAGGPDIHPRFSLLTEGIEALEKTKVLPEDGLSVRIGGQDFRLYDSADEMSKQVFTEFAEFCTQSAFSAD